ncbi:MAG: M64 family metallopeptidase [Pseudomonadota bacterium]
MFGKLSAFARWFIASLVVALSMATLAAAQPFDAKQLMLSGEFSDQSAKVIVVYGDGFDADEQDVYNRAVDERVMAGLRLEGSGPFVSAFKVVRVNLISPESGISTVEESVSQSECRNLSSFTVDQKDTVFNFTLSGKWPWGCADRAKLSAQFSAIESALRLSPDFRYIILNSQLNGAWASGTGDYAMTTLASPADTYAHEFGHMLIGLNDEYTVEQSEIEEADDPDQYRLDNTYSGNPINAANSSTASTRNGVSWSGLIAPGTPVLSSRTDIVDAPFYEVVTRQRNGVSRAEEKYVGIFEGSDYHTYGAFRPTLNNRMNSSRRMHSPIAMNEYWKAFANNVAFDDSDTFLGSSVYPVDFVRAIPDYFRYNAPVPDNSGRDSGPTLDDGFKDLVFVDDFAVTAYRTDPYIFRPDYATASFSMRVGPDAAPDPFGFNLEPENTQPVRLADQKGTSLMLVNHFSGVNGTDIVRFLIGEDPATKRLRMTSPVHMADVLDRTFDRPGRFKALHYQPTDTEPDLAKHDLIYWNRRSALPVFALLTVEVDETNRNSDAGYGRLALDHAVYELITWGTSGGGVGSGRIADIDDIVPGDFDGDGEDEFAIRFDRRYTGDSINAQDIVILKPVSGGRTGRGFTAIGSLQDTGNVETNWNFDQVFAADVNGDDKDELVILWQELPRRDAEVRVYEATNGVLEKDPVTDRGPWGGIDTFTDRTGFAFGDFNGDGRDDLSIVQNYQRDREESIAGAFSVMLADRGRDTTAGEPVFTHAPLDDNPNMLKFWRSGALNAVPVPIDLDSDGRMEIVLNDMFFMVILSVADGRVFQNAAYVHYIYDALYNSSPMINSYATDLR